MSKDNRSSLPPSFLPLALRNTVLGVALLGILYVCFNGLFLAIVRNESREELNGVQIGFEEYMRWQGTLDDGQSKWLVGFVRPEGWAFIHIENESRTIEQRCGYETFMSIDAVVLTIGSDMKIACEERRLPWL